MKGSPTFGSDDLELDWQSTPALWLAYRKGQCFCEDCRYSVTVGTGKTQDEAVADFNEKSRDD